LVLVLLLFVAVGNAWGRAGHRVIASLGRSFLSPAAAKNILLWVGNSTLPALSLLPDSTWPGNDWSRPLHYANMPEPINGSVLHYNIDIGCANMICVVSAIKNYSYILSKVIPTAPVPELPPSPLSFLVHFVGDVHQPLHISYASDKGGNNIPVQFFNSTTSSNLHQVWDTLILTKYRSSWPQIAAELRNNLVNNQTLYQEYARETDPSVWADESYQITATDGYTFNFTSTAADKIYIGQEYYERNLPIILQRLTQGGVRLATLLNKIFGKS